MLIRMSKKAIKSKYDEMRILKFSNSVKKTIKKNKIKQKQFEFDSTQIYKQ